MSVQKPKGQVSTNVQNLAHGAPRNITSHSQSRGQTPPVYSNLREEPSQYPVYQGVSFLGQSYQVPHLSQQQQQQGNTHELDKQLASQQGLAGPRPAVAQQQTMYSNPSLGRAQPQPFYPSQGQNMMQQQQQRAYPPPISQPPQPMYQGGSTFMYMQPSQGSGYPQGGPQIIVQPQNLPMMVPGPGSRVPQPHNQFMQTPQTGVPYQMPQTGNQQFNPITVYATQNQGQRPPSAPVTAQSSQPQPKREKHILTIVDPNTGKDVTNETLHPVASARATPPGSGGSGSGSRSASLGNTPPPSVPVVPNATGATSAIAAQFAAQVAATLKPDTQDAAQQDISQQPTMSSQIPVEGFQQEKPEEEVVNEIPQEPSNVQNMNVITDETAPVYVPLESSVNEPHPVSAEVSVKPDSNTDDNGALETEYTQSLSNTNSSQQEQESEILTEVSTVNTTQQQATAPLELSDTPSVLGGGDNSSAVVMPQEKAASEPPVIQNPTEPQLEVESSNMLNSESKSKEERTSKEPSPELSTVESKIGQPEETKYPEVVPETETAKELPVQHIEEPKSEQGSASNDSNLADVAASNMKKDKGKKKHKDLNKKGEGLQGTDMDAFLESQPSEVKQTSPAPQPTTTDVKPAAPVEPVEELETPEEIPKVEIKIQDDKVQSENEKNQEKSKESKVNHVEKESKAPELKYKYKEDQWSPLNPEGKRLYDREFLLSIQFASESTSRPHGLPDLPDIILDKPHGQQQGSRYSGGGGGGGGGPREFSSSSGAFDFTPGYVRSPRVGGSSERGGTITKRGSNQGRKPGGPPPRIITHVSLNNQDVKLHKADEAWKPSRKADSTGSENADDKKTEAIYKKVRSILNKLTPQRFQTLVKQMADLEIDTDVRLQGVTDLVFEKAVSEPGFSVAYASMCRYLAMIKVPSKTKPGEFVNFRAILLTRCQKEFEKDKDAEVDLEKKRKELIEAKVEDQELLKMELEYAETMARKRSLGNIRFIGELFKLKMLTENIMHDCVFKLLKAKDPDSLECLCRLLTTIGKELDTDKAKPRMDQYFQQMSKVVSEKKMTSRIRFMLQDVIELRQNKWVPRRDENNPKTLDQIHKDAQREEQERQIAIQQAAVQQATRGNDRQGRGRRGGSQQGGQPGGSDGWNTVQGRQPGMRLTTTERQTIDPSRLKLSRQNVDEGIQLGPGGGAGRFAGWQRGSTGGGARASQEGERPNAPSNRFSALSRPEEESRGKVGASPNRGRGFGRPARVTPRSSQEQERERVLAAVRSISGGQTTPRDGPSRESSRGRETKEEKKVEKPPQAAPTKKLSEEEMEKKTKSILDEYLHLQDIKEAILCVEELNCPDMLHVFVSQTLNYVLERSEVARRQTGHLLHDLISKGVLPVNVYITGLHEILQYAEDMEIDIPKIWQYFGELISPMIQDGSVNLSFLKSAVEPLKASNKSGVLLAEILHDASNREGHKTIAGLWKASGLQWSDFVSADKVKQFLIDRKLEFTETGTSQPSTPVVSMPMEKVREHLDSLLQRKNANEEIFDWIESNLDDATTKSKKFVRTLMTAVCSSAISGKGSSAKVDPRQVTLRRVILQKYLDHQADFELQALYALQALVHKLEHPPGVLQELFDTLYDEDVISEDAFNQWQKSDDCAEQEGKGVAVSSVVQFFTWLGEAEDMSDS